MCIYRRERETALLEKIQDPSEVKDCEQKRSLMQPVTCMELLTTREKNEIMPYDSEVLNVKLHERSVAPSVNSEG